MKTCKDCIHYEACHRKDREIPANTCRTFKDKSIVLELPFPPGGDVYFIDEGIILELTIAIMHIGFVSDEDTYYECIDSESNEGYWDFKNSDIDKNVFLTREAAEQALKECEQGLLKGASKIDKKVL